ncbi:4Fe-4S binding protein [Isachenkonia alkalipeptolytica]|uniref:4Fe-4S ferredoxin n=1 Tax=Isachenkonia alkalipeptolytica TaxID=2565777 RepID=A0AA43XL38_9CLOT|nr:4Fe-4S binding protein [Isachenkonia alkalipeptolytica]NBG88254.1 4Fe-4S ferredoxin [Isachenkonia alkalipeptolytica]
MKKAVIKESTCDKSPFCPAKRVCTVNAIDRSSFLKPFKVIAERCIGCGKCINVCPQRAIIMKKA